jgi:EAL domain-containing protein (putative c-di-GMP-specific phosphodiesterase class I)
MRLQDRLKALGVPVAIDDFGTGYSSLSYISRLRPDELKLDKSLIASVDTDAERAGVVVAALAMAQGFLYDRPMPAGEFVRWLAGPLTAA